MAASHPSGPRDASHGPGAPATAAGDALRATGAAVRDADPGDAVAGVAPRWVASPASTEEVAALMRVSAGYDLAVVPVGGGTKQAWGDPPQRCDLVVGTSSLVLGGGSAVEHSCGDLVARVSAGLPFDVLQSALAASGQELALDGPVPGGTVGGMLATAAAGPRRLRYGTARDLLIGITVVLADGTVARSGGKVVKNVAGYDLGKLFTGSYGTLGIITEAVFRLHPVPPARRWVTTALPAPAAAGESATGFPVGPGALATALAASQAEPSAVELDWLAPSGAPALSVLVEGTAAGDRAETVRGLVGSGRATGVRAEAVRDLAGGGDGPAPGGRVEAVPETAVTRQAPGWWGAPPGEVLLELRIPPSGVDRALSAVAGRGLPARVRGSLASAVLQIALPGEVGAAAFAAFVSGVRADVAPLGGRLTVLAAPAELARLAGRWGPVAALPLMRRVKERFDPGRRMSPGRMAGGL
ncbi:FAD-binding oxidoreductase [Planomonospora venezuelensis]|uniref:Glycolate oxidase FAD binding subunit n=1 Tax=Planomonospora venezuelensis TaxID=1999 RepID=A0A841D889_PLAVE|nr:FAD-binding oxidoreductase [Planomonospora venezuelensis]MBB5964538.1 glycolate oxidase FAD binding subunit [Planomonospora venezuelensis]GIN02835.1 FAD-linked oxidase [Planomonospora venezuelensis]